MKALKIHETRIYEIIKALNSRENKTEVPVGCSIYNSNGELISMQFNEIESVADATNHAELLAIKKVSQQSKNSNLEGYCLYVNLEPCLMCLGAIHHANISQVIFGAYSDLNIKNQSFLNLFREIYPNIEIIGGVLENECKEQISTWFKSIR